MADNAQSIHILRMEYSDGTCSYYHVPQEWVTWVSRSTEVPPDSLVEALTLEYGEEGAMALVKDQFSLRTLQVLAVDSNYIGSKLNAVVNFATGRPIVELNGTWY